MKKVIITLITVFAVSAAFAQFEQGRILAGGSVGLSTNKNKTEANNVTVTNSKSTTFSFMPKVGFFVVNNLAIGAGIDLSATTYKSEGSGDKDKLNSASIAPFVRYYLKPGIFFQGAFGVGSEKYKDEAGNAVVTTKYGTNSWSLGAGYAYFLNNKVAIEPFIGYGGSTSKNKSNDIKNINSGLFIKFGFQIYLDTKK